MPLPPRLTVSEALFLDFDGTLVDLAPSPERIVVAPALTDALQRLHEQLQGALAIVSGRPLSELDRWLAPLVLPAAGVHGAERRGAGGKVTALATPALAEVAEVAGQLADQHRGLRVERKGAAVALHYREAPQLQALCVRVFGAAVEAAPGLKLLHGKCVLEALPAGVSKGHAIEAFLAELPFAARRPVFIGDDVTDEAGFEVVQRRGGIAVKVGPGASVATTRLAGAAEVRGWLQSAAFQDETRRTTDARSA